MKDKILQVLREADDFISGQEICNRFSVSRTAVWKAIKQLRDEGYSIELAPSVLPKMAFPFLRSVPELALKWSECSPCSLVQLWNLFSLR